MFQDKSVNWYISYSVGIQGYIFCKILWLGGGDGAGEKKKKWGKMKRRKRGKEKEEK